VNPGAYTSPFSPAAAGNQEKALEFHRIAQEVYAPVYPLIASQALAWDAWFNGPPRGPKTGSCLDIGSAAGHVGIELARQSQMEVTLFDLMPEALALSAELLANDPAAARIHTRVGDAHSLPFGDQSFELVVSRGAVWFWPDRARAFGEIWRVLKPGGLALVGGGYGTRELRDAIFKTMSQRNGADFKERHRQIRGDTTAASLATCLSGLELPFMVIDDDTGLWALLHKPNA
jgi:SAM-dependent methyltransferase